MEKTLRILNPRNIKILLYIYEHNGEIIGFREAAKDLGKGYGTLRDALKDLEYIGLIEKEIVRGVVGRYFITKKGKEVAGKLKEILDLLAKP